MTTLLPMGKQQFSDANGVPLAGGSVAFYIPGTTTPKNTWQDPSQVTLNTNPVILDAAGEAIIYGLGVYRQIVQDSLANTIWDQLTSSTDQGGIYSGGTSTGTAANQIVATTVPAGFSLVAGSQLTFTPGFSSTGPTTLNANGTGAKNILKWGAAGPVATVAGDIVLGNALELYFDGTQYQILSSVQPPAILRGSIAGCTLSNDGVAPNTVLDIAAGQIADSTNTKVINLAAITKSTGGVWAAGSGSNGMGTGLTVANNTWYHVFAIVVAGAADVYFDTSITAANKPAGTTAFRRLGSFKTSAASTNIRTFVQQGPYFWWGAAQISELSASAFPTASRTLLTLGGVPPGLSTVALLSLEMASTDQFLLTDPAMTDSVPSPANLSTSATTSGAGEVQIRTDTTPRIGYRSVNGAVGSINAKGWYDFRGTDL